MNYACVEMRNAYNILAGKPERMRQFGRPSRRWEGNTEMGVWEIVFERVNWIHLAQDRDRWRAIVNTVIKLRFP
jgi:hypothetical protein